MDKEGNKHDNGGKSIKCKYCKMGFENKERLKVHTRIAHSGRGERKKMIMDTNPFLSLYAMSF